MDDKRLIQFSLVIALLGLAALFVLAQEIDIGIVTVDTITDEFIGQRVAIQGNIVSVRSLDSMVLFDVQGLNSVGSILVVVFDPLELSVGDAVLVSGTIKDYNGQLEVVAEKVEVQ
jgi:RecJ-like exonuclease